MTAPRTQDNASPRFPRGLALLSLTGVLLIVYTSLTKRGGNDTPSAAADLRAGETHPQAARREHSRPRAFRASASREDRWSKRLAAIEADLAAGIAITDMPAILDDLQTAGFGMHESTGRLLRRWAKAEGRPAAAWAEQLPAGQIRENALSSVAVEWANTDLSSTVKWARQLPDAAEQQTLLLAAANEAVRTEPVEALRLAVEFSEGTEGGETIRRAAMEWASKDPSAAIEWAKTIPDEGLRHVVLAAELVAWSETAPADAAALAVKKLPGGRLLDDTVVSIVQRWAQTDARTAAAWVEQFPESSLRAAAIENLVSQWRQTDPVTAQQWQARNL